VTLTVAPPPSLDDNERAIRRARLDLEAALADVRAGLHEVDEAITMFKRLEEDLVAGRRSIKIEGDE
jgi:hypothetical protein